MQNTVNFRGFAQGDWPAYRDMTNMFYGEAEAGPPKDLKGTFDMCVSNSPYVRGIIIENGGKTAGFSLITSVYSNEFGGMIVWVDELFVLPEFRSKGLGFRFFEFIEEEYKGRAVQFSLDIIEPNPRAVKLYERVGFRASNRTTMLKMLQ